MNFLSTVLAQDTEVSMLTVICMGMGIVFAALICLVLLCKLVGFVVGRFAPADKASSAPAPAAPVATDEIPDRSRVLAAISVAIAEELGTDPAGIRIVSIKRV